MMPRKATVWTAEELRQLFGIESRGGLSYLAGRHGWERITGYTGDIEGLYYARARRDLARAMGEAVQGVVRHDNWDRDDNCPICGGFAIWKPATLEEQVSEAYQNNWPWLCVNGHSDESEG